MTQSLKLRDQRSNIKDQKLKLFTLSLALIFALCTLRFNTVRAQSLSLSISPPILEVMIKPGKSITQTYKISNEGETVIAIPRLGELSDAGLKDDPKFTPETWITLANTDLSFGKPFLFESKTQKQLIVKINPPPGTIEQDYYRAILLTTKPNPSQDASQSLISQTIGAPLILWVTATGLIPKEGSISKFTLPKVLDSFDALNVDIDIKNNGKTYFRSMGKIFLRGPIGRGTFEISPDIILTGQTKTLSLQNYESEQNSIHTLSLSGIYLGKYEVEADLTLDAGKVKLNQKKIFYALPWKAGLIAFAVLILYIIRNTRREKIVIKKK